MGFPNDLPVALSTARIAVERHVSRADRIGVTWREETVSELIWVNTDVGGRMPVRVADFNKAEEESSARTGSGGSSTTPVNA